LGSCRQSRRCRYRFSGRRRRILMRVIWRRKAVRRISGVTDGLQCRKKEL
jgi:hypothetical protein